MLRCDKTRTASGRRALIRSDERQKWKRCVVDVVTETKIKELEKTIADMEMIHTRAGQLNGMKRHVNKLMNETADP